MLLKWQVKKLVFQLIDLMNSGMKKKVFETLSDNYKIRQEKEKMWKHLGKTRNDK